ncbi:MAG: Stp1/IreP family PP2C-type Ser/Thr phosphatase [Pseudanabaenaceae cyanobacterium]|jgi:protein phosphatase
MKRLFAGDSDTGCVRSANQDYWHTDADGRFFVVADGMGGHAGGEEASRIATDTIREYLESDWANDLSAPVLLQNAIDKANAAILQDQREHPARSDMGTTVVIVMVRDEQFWFCHIGDSRLYRLRGHEIHQISEDHTWIAKAVQNGIVTAEESRVHPWRHMLLQCLGREDLRPIQAQKIELQPEDRLLICSDGLTEELTDGMIATKMKQIRSCSQAARALIDAAKEHGGRDNITVVIVSNELPGASA